MTRWRLSSSLMYLM